MTKIRQVYIQFDAIFVIYIARFIRVKCVRDVYKLVQAGSCVMNKVITTIPEAIVQVFKFC